VISAGSPRASVPVSQALNFGKEKDMITKGRFPHEISGTHTENAVLAILVLILVLVFLLLFTTLTAH
jgi:hypothetical protein